MAEMQQKDLVLNPNEYAYLLDRTKGIVSCYVGPIKTSLSNTDSPVRFNSRTKRFEECYLDDANYLFMTAPENWYIILKNPESNGKHPAARTANELPNLDIGKKVNITGPVSFALYPGQMARAVQGHRLRSNQYLLVRVYDEESAKANWKNSVIKTKDSSNSGEDSQSPENATAEDKAVAITDVTSDDLTVGKIMVIKGTEVSFYIPPTGIEVLPITKGSDDYIREAVTLERLEYCILKDEDGNKRYVHGPAVVFPEPTESFIANQSDNYKFRAIELSKISGIYVKVIADYEEDGKIHKVGEELFITGKDQMIYYPRPEHAIITYGNRIVHHAVAIPAGEGRYVMDRMTGKITTVKGPEMFLPDPRTQVIVKRKLTRNQATLWYPGNKEVLEYNEGLSDANQNFSGSCMTAAENALKQFSYDVSSAVTPMELAESSLMSRSTTFTPPRSITIDNKFDGVVSIDIWTGYAVNVISKDGTRKVVVGPCTNLMDYDQTLEVLEISTGKPKTTDNLLRTVFLRVDNNKISDIIRIETKDFVTVDIKVSYCVDFLAEYKDRWFSVENYVKYLCDRVRSLLKREAKKYSIEEFYQNAANIVRNVALDITPIDEYTEQATAESGRTGRFFPENGMLLHDVEVLSTRVDEGVADIIQQHQEETIRKSIELSDAEQRIKLTTAIAEADAKIAEIKYESEKKKLDLDSEIAQKRTALKTAEQKAQHDQEMAKLKAQQDEQKIADILADAKLAREEKENKSMLDYQAQLAEIDKQRNQAYAEAIVTMLSAMSPQLAASIEQLSNHALFADVAQKISPLAIVNGSSIADTANKLLKGTALEGLMEAFCSSQLNTRLVEPEPDSDTDSDWEDK